MVYTPTAVQVALSLLGRPDAPPSLLRWAATQPSADDRFAARVLFHPATPKDVARTVVAPGSTLLAAAFIRGIRAGISARQVWDQVTGQVPSAGDDLYDQPLLAADPDKPNLFVAGRLTATLVLRHPHPDNAGELMRTLEISGWIHGAAAGALSARAYAEHLAWVRYMDANLTSGTLVHSDVHAVVDGLRDLLGWDTDAVVDTVAALTHPQVISAAVRTLYPSDTVRARYGRRLMDILVRKVLLPGAASADPERYTPARTVMSVFDKELDIEHLRAIAAVTPARRSGAGQPVVDRAVELLRMRDPARASLGGLCDREDEDAIGAWLLEHLPAGADWDVLVRLAGQLPATATLEDLLDVYAGVNA